MTATSQSVISSSYSLYQHLANDQHSFDSLSRSILDFFLNHCHSFTPSDSLPTAPCFDLVSVTVIICYSSAPCCHFFLRLLSVICCCSVPCLVHSARSASSSSCPPSINLASSEPAYIFVSVLYLYLNTSLDSLHRRFSFVVFVYSLISSFVRDCTYRVSGVLLSVRTR